MDAVLIDLHRHHVTEEARAALAAEFAQQANDDAKHYTASMFACYSEDFDELMNAMRDDDSTPRETLMLAIQKAVNESPEATAALRAFAVYMGRREAGLQ